MMSYTPISKGCGPVAVIDDIAQRFALKIRRADVIDHDPEGQRIKSLLKEACLEAYKFAVPDDDGKTTHVTVATGEDG